MPLIYLPLIIYTGLMECMFAPLRPKAKQTDAATEARVIAIHRKDLRAP